MTQPTITTADRELFIDIFGDLTFPVGLYHKLIMAGKWDHDEKLIRIATARQAESDRWAKAIREAVRRGYVTIESDDKCAHGVYTCDDCIACYNEALLAAITTTENAT